MISTFSVQRLVAFALVLLSVSPLAAQLNENCTVSVLNRTAQVNAAGFWQITNIPADQGPIRARAVCTENGITTFGVSEWMNVPLNGLVFSEGVTFEAPPPVPASMTLTATKTALANLGDTSQLQVALTFPDGSARIVNSASGGTSYTSTNRNVATVSEDGLVTATGTGSVIIGAANEGALAMIRISIASGPLDSDRDGMPDDWERTYGLNPNSAADATLDRDGDGLSNRAEFTAGTDPTRADTDGDGVSDGLELQTGSDPLDAGSVNLPAALQSIRTAPGAVVLTKNVTDDKTVARIRVEGVLRDGGIIDLTARSTGTVYTSSNLQIASLTLVDGEVFAGANGTAILTVANGAFTATAPIIVTSSTPAPLSRVDMPGHANDVEVSGNFAYVAAGDAGLQVVDVSDRTRPRIVGSYDTPGMARTLRVSGARVYVADSEEGLTILDVSIPTQPALVAQVPVTGVVYDVAVSGGYAYLAAQDGGLVVVSLQTNGVVAQLQGPQLISIDVSGGVAVASTQFFVVALDVSNPLAPVERGRVQGITAVSVRIRGNRAYTVASGYGMYVIDISNPAALRVVIRPRLDRIGSPIDVAFFENWFVAAHVFNAFALPLWDAANADDPAWKMNVPLGNGGGEYSATGADLDATYVYETATIWNQGRIGSAEGATTTLYIGNWRAPRDDFGNPPAVSVGADTVEAGTTAAIEVTATDDVAVTAVMLSVNGQQLPADTSRPYVFSFPVPAGAPTVALVARAADLGGNLTTVDATLTVVPDTTAPVARILIPSNGQTYGGGTTIPVYVDGTDAGPVIRVEAFADGVSLGTSNSPGGSFDYVVPNVDGNVTFTGRATDHAGNVGNAAPVVITTKRDNPPAVTLTYTPLLPLHTGAELLLKVTATDDFGVTAIDFLVDGTVAGTRTYFPYELLYTIPPGKSQVVIAAIATDTRGQTTMSTQFTIPVQPTSALGALPLAGYTNDVAVYGSYAFVAGGSAGLHVVDIADPAAPVLVTTLQTSGSVNRLDLRWPYVFLAAGTGGLQVVNVTDPAAPEVIASLSTSGPAHDVFYRNDRVYVGQELGFDIVNVADPRAPKRVVFRATQKPVVGIAAREGALFLSMEHTDPNQYYARLIHGMQISNETNPTNGSTLVLQSGKHANMTFHNDRLYVGGEYEFFVVRANSAFPALLGQTSNLDYHCCYYDSKISGTTAVVASAEHNRSIVPLVSVATMNNSLPHLGTVDFSQAGTHYSLAIDITPELLYTVGIDQYPDSLQNRALAQSRFLTGRYRTIADTAAAAPTVSVVSPLNGANATAGQTLRVQVAAADDAGVKSVRILAGGVQIAETEAPPFEVLYTLPVGVPSVAFTAVAVDYGGRTTTSATVTVNVAADTVLPVARVTMPTAGRSLSSLTVKLAAEATDNVSVTRVEFLVDGNVVATDRTLPFEVTHELAPATASATFAVRAFDPSGNVTESAPVVSPVSAPVTIGVLALPSFPYDLDTNGNTAVVGTEGGVQIVDITVPGSPAIVATVPTPEPATSVRLLGHYAYVSCLQGQFFTIDISTPSAPVVVHSAGPGSAWKLAVSRLTAYTMWGSLRFWNLTVPSAPTASSFGTGLGAIDADDPRFVIGQKDLRAFTGGTLTASRTLFDSWSSAEVKSVRYKHGYVAAGIWPASGFIVSNADDKFTWLTYAGGNSSAVYVDFLDDTLVTVGDSTRASLYDFTNQREPLLRTSVDFGAGDMTAVRLTARYLLALSTSPGYRLNIAKYRDFADAAGIAPVVSVPSLGTARVGRLSNLRADASDDVGVAQVVFNVNGTDVFTDTIAPYELNYLVPAGMTRLDVRARALDYGGNETVSALRSVTVTP